MTQPILQKLHDVPERPGVYLMKDADDSVIYVGKAQNLRKRLRSYFGRTSDTRFFVGLLGQVLADIDIITTQTGNEALLLENQLIKTHKPRFNVQLKDDKNFLSLRLSSNHSYPRLEVVRKRKDDGSRYFGPYSSAAAIRSTLRFVNRYFQLRTCTDVEFNNRSRPCLEYQIGRCPAPCILTVPKQDYDHSIEQVALFLSGSGIEVLKQTRRKMNAAAKSTDFEQAARWRDQLHAIEKTLEKQSVSISKPIDLDVFGLAREGLFVALHVQQVRAGIIQHARAYKLGRNETPDRAIVGQFLQQYYENATEIPPTVLLPCTIDDMEWCEQWLSLLRGTRVRCHVPHRGERRQLMDGAIRNAVHVLEMNRQRSDQTLEILADLQRKLKLARLPERMECFDISNFQGKSPVSSMVVFIDGEPAKGYYRRFHIRSKQTPDDYAMMLETLRRRFARLGEPCWEKPDLVIVDGGKGQLNVARQALQELGIDDVELIGLAKARTRTTRSSDEVNQSPERVFLPNVKDPVVLRKTSAPLYLLTRIRDEAHRFAITFHRKTRQKKQLQTRLDSIAGLGPKRQKSLLQHFGSAQAVERATVEELSSIDGISRTMANRIKERSTP